MNKKQIVEAVKEEKRRVVAEFKKYSGNILYDFEKAYLCEQEGISEYIQVLQVLYNMHQKYITNLKETSLAKKSSIAFERMLQPIDSEESIIDRLSWNVRWDSVEGYKELSDKLQKDLGDLIQAYNDILANLKLCKSAKQSLEYLRSIGMEIDIPTDSKTLVFTEVNLDILKNCKKVVDKQN